MISLSFYELLLISMATFRLTHLFVFDKITEFIRRPFHEVQEELQVDGTVVEYINIKGKGIRKFVGELLSCYWCTGIWTAAFLFLGYMFCSAVFFWIITILAIAGLAAIIEAVIQRLIA